MHEVLFVCQYVDMKVVFKFPTTVKFESLMSKIIERWPKIEIDSTVLDFSITNSESFALENDEDLQSLMLMAHSRNSIEVYVNITRRELFVGEGTQQANAVNNHDIECPKSLRTDPLSTFCSHTEKYRVSDHWKRLIREVDQVFIGGVTQFRNDLSKFSIELGFKFVFLKNDLERVTAICYHAKDRNCCWRVHARVNKYNGFFYIRDLNNIHSCGSSTRSLKNKRISSNIIANEVIDEVKNNPLLSPADVRKRMKITHGFHLRYNHVWKGVEKAKTQLYGHHELSYDDLRWYKDITMKSNPGSKIELDYNHLSGKFNRLFVSFEACIHGFNFCRPLIFLDGTFLKGRYKGMLLAATGKDGNDGLFNIGFAVVDSENLDNWDWFLKQLKGVLDPNRTITFVSDRNNGLLKAVSNVFPKCYHAFCLRHLKDNLKDKIRGGAGAGAKEFKEKMLSLIHHCAFTPSTRTCQEKLAQLRLEGKQPISKFLEDAPVENWSNAYFKGQRYGEMTSNAAESFNSWIRVARALPILLLVDTIREQLMNDITKCRKFGLSMEGIICPKYDKMLGEAIDEGRSWFVNESSQDVYEVKSTPSVSVNLKDRTCSCCKWQINGFPCPHAVAAILSCNINVSLFVEDYFHTQMYLKTYANSIYPVPTVDKPVVSAQDIVVHPPQTKNPPGRPRKRRFSRYDENTGTIRQITCSRCGLPGNHNAKTCKVALK